MDARGSLVDKESTCLTESVNVRINLHLSQAHKIHITDDQVNILNTKFPFLPPRVERNVKSQHLPRPALALQPSCDGQPVKNAVTRGGTYATSEDKA
ncbi:hypothetical protein E2C01_066509 [Portunus trituberculatus]|uniref:Uncharacterized protein n=1 Tax=Portunus trituberculatus TaxID=210409 RepID=A0A5B7HH98_PORTR|nr:hypothetical protein [Portunus trituberculatus]